MHIHVCAAFPKLYDLAADDIVNISYHGRRLLPMKLCYTYKYQGVETKGIRKLLYNNTSTTDTKLTTLAVTLISDQMILRLFKRKPFSHH